MRHTRRMRNVRQPVAHTHGVREGGGEEEWAGEKSRVRRVGQINLHAVFGVANNGRMEPWNMLEHSFGILIFSPSNPHPHPHPPLSLFICTISFHVLFCFYEHKDKFTRSVGVQATRIDVGVQRNRPGRPPSVFRRYRSCDSIYLFIVTNCNVNLITVLY